MACLHPIAIKNKRYAGQPADYVASMLTLYPEDIARQTLMVPCGKCPECLRANRNAWYVRLNRELACQKRRNGMSYFITITINPLHYDKAFENPASFIRSFFERIRHAFGYSIKHALFQELSPEKNRLHFHGLLFGRRIDLRKLHKIVRDLGFIWIIPANSRVIRYCVKYVTKSISDFESAGVDFDRRYRRKFVSAHVGDDIVGVPVPSFDTRTWSFYDSRTGVTFSYSIPRYYDRYLSETESRKRHAEAGLLFCRASGLPFPARVCLEVLQELFSGVIPERLNDSSILNRLYKLNIRSIFAQSPKLPRSNFNDIEPNYNF